MHEILMTEEESKHRIEYRNKYVLVDTPKDYVIEPYEYRSDALEVRTGSKDIKKLTEENDRYI